MKKNLLFCLMIFAVAAGYSQKKSKNSNSKAIAENASGSITIIKGQKYVVENKLTTSSSSEMQGQTMESNADIASTYNIEVSDLKDTNYSMTNTLSSIKMNMTTMGQNINFDSDKKEDMDGEMGNAVKNFINKPNAVLMDRSGKIIITPDADSAKESSATTQTEMILKQMGDPAEQGYGAKMAFMSLPKNFKQGAAWTDSTTQEGVTRVTNYTVKEINGNIATISISGTEARDTKMEMQGMEIYTKTNGKFSGEEMVDVTNGVVSQNNTTAEASGNITVMGQEIPTTIKATSITTVKAL